MVSSVCVCVCVCVCICNTCLVYGKREYETGEVCAGY